MVIKLGGSILGLVVVSIFGGCSFAPLDLSNRGCDCAPGWVCLEEENRCIRRSANVDSGNDAADSGSTDAQSDTPGADAAAADAAGADGASDGGGDAGISDASDAGIGTCEAVEGALVCETFEMIAPAWSPLSFSGSVEISTTFSYSPENSVRSTTTAPTGYAAFKRTDLPTLGIGETFYLRLAVYPPAGGEFSFIRIGENLGGYGGLTLSIQDGALEAALPENGDAATTENSFRFAEWNCVEARVLVGQAGLGEVEFRLNSGPPSFLNSVDTLPPAGYEAMVVGIRASSADAALVYLDDVVLSSTPLPCDG